MKEEIEINWFFMGAKLAMLSDTEQADFFRGFANEIDSWDTHTVKEMQMLYINAKLSDKTKKILETYLPAIYYKEK